MSEMTLFKGKAQLPTLPAGFVDPVTDVIAGNSGGGRRISIRGKAFRQVVGGKEVNVSEENLLDVVIINAAPISRMHYAGDYVEGVTTAPTCWSADTLTPAAAVPAENRQASRCADCPMNIKGSGKSDSRACRFSQRIAVVLDGEIEDKQVYQLQLPATSVFGDAEGNKMGLQAYARFLKANNANAISLVTRMKFETAATQPKLLFSAVRPLTQEELDICVELRDHPDTIDAITLTVGETDGAKPAAVAAPAAPAKKAKPAPVVEADEDEDEVPVPKKKAKPAPVVEDDEEEEAPAPKKKAKPAPVIEDDEDEEDEIPAPRKAAPKKTAAPEPEESGNLADLMSEWDD